MKTHVSLGAARSFELREALLVYRADRSFGHTSEADAFVTRHVVALTAGGVPRLGPGSALGESDLLSMMDALRGALPIEYLPATVLARTQESVVWWSPASVRPIFYAMGKATETDELSGQQFPQPGLVFRARHRSLDVRAVAGSNRPEKDAVLYRAPYWNVNDQGSICLGSSRVPNGISLDTLDAWEKGFFSSEFTHSNAHKPLTRHPGGFAGLWKSLAGETVFPNDCLAEAGQTLGQFIKG